MNEQVDVSRMSAEQLEALLRQKKAEEQSAAEARRKAYEGLKNDVIDTIEGKVRQTVGIVRELYDAVVSETGAFYETMKEYGMLKSTEQRSYTLQSASFKIEVKSNKIKRFDERADIAASRLIEFLNSWIRGRSNGESDPMYRLAMAMLERNRYGDLDYKSISKLYEMEAQFNDPEYSAIMQLFKESNVVEGAAVNFYFYEKDKLGNWRRLEPSFNRM